MANLFRLLTNRLFFHHLKPPIAGLCRPPHGMLSSTYEVPDNKETRVHQLTPLMKLISHAAHYIPQDSQKYMMKLNRHLATSDVNLSNSHGTTMLMSLADNAVNLLENYHDCYHKVLTNLIEHGANVNAQSEEGVTALMYLLQHTHTLLAINPAGLFSICESMINAGYDLSLVNDKKDSTLLYLAHHGNACLQLNPSAYVELLSLLLKNGASLWQRNINNVTPLIVIVAQLTDYLLSTWNAAQVKSCMAAIFDHMPKKGNFDDYTKFHLHIQSASDPSYIKVITDYYNKQKVMNDEDKHLIDVLLMLRTKSFFNLSHYIPPARPMAKDIFFALYLLSWISYKREVSIFLKEMLHACLDQYDRVNPYYHNSVTTMHLAAAMLSENVEQCLLYFPFCKEQLCPDMNGYTPSKIAQMNNNTEMLKVIPKIQSPCNSLKHTWTDVYNIKMIQWDPGKGSLELHEGDTFEEANLARDEKFSFLPTIMPEIKQCQKSQAWRNHGYQNPCPISKHTPNHITEVKAVVKEMIRRIQESMNGTSSLCVIDVQPCGSVANDTKVGLPDEFDVSFWVTPRNGSFLLSISDDGLVTLKTTCQRLHKMFGNRYEDIEVVPLVLYLLQLLISAFQMTDLRDLPIQVRQCACPIVLDLLFPLPNIRVHIDIMFRIQQPKVLLTRGTSKVLENKRPKFLNDPSRLLMNPIYHNDVVFSKYRFRGRDATLQPTYIVYDDDVMQSIPSVIKDGYRKLKALVEAEWWSRGAHYACVPKYLTSHYLKIVLFYVLDEQITRGHLKKLTLNDTNANDRNHLILNKDLLKSDSWVKLVLHHIIDKVDGGQSAYFNPYIDKQLQCFNPQSDPLLKYKTQAKRFCNAILNSHYK